MSYCPCVAATGTRVSAMEGEADGVTTARLSFRPDIEGLRAIAVGLVVLLHAGATGVSGGYAGVDVFFVISGFLITSLLMHEFGSTHRISILGFYARRARRILPAACLVIVVTVIAVYGQLGVLIGRTTATTACGPPSSWPTSASSPRAPTTSTRAAAVGVAALLVARRRGAVLLRLADGLLRLDGARPAARAVGAHVAARARRAGRALLGVVDPPERGVTDGRVLLAPHACMGTGRGGLDLGVLAAHLQDAPGGARGGDVDRPRLIMITAFTFTSTTVFPGYAALLPVGGTALVIAGGIGSPGERPCCCSGANRSAGSAASPSRSTSGTGLCSSSPSNARRNLSTRCCRMRGDLLVFLVASYYLVERPMHVSSFLKSLSTGSDWLRSRKALLAGFVAIAVAVSVSVATARRATSNIDAALHVRDISPAAWSQAHERPSSRARTYGQDRGAGRARAPHGAARPQAARPRLKTAFDQTYIRCMQEQTDQVAARTCTFGAVKSHHTIIVLGDSHAMSWMPALDAYGKAAGYKVVTLYKARCPLPDELPVWSGGPSALQYIAYIRRPQWSSRSPKATPRLDRVRSTAGSRDIGRHSQRSDGPAPRLRS